MKNWKELPNLGLIFDYKMDFHLFYEDITNRALKILDFMCRNSADSRSVNSFKILYTSEVRSALEYITPV